MYCGCSQAKTSNNVVLQLPPIKSSMRSVTFLENTHWQTITSVRCLDCCITVIRKQDFPCKVSENTLSRSLKSVFSLHEFKASQLPLTGWKWRSASLIINNRTCQKMMCHFACLCHNFHVFKVIIVHIVTWYFLYPAVPLCKAMAVKNQYELHISNKIAL